MSKSPDELFRRVEVITSAHCCRKSSTGRGGHAAEHDRFLRGTSSSGISPSQLFAWKRRMLEGGYAAVQADEDVVGASQVRALEKRVRDLERMLGKKTMEVEILKEALDLDRPNEIEPGYFIEGMSIRVL